MKTKAMIFGAAAIASSMLMAADTPEVENVVMSQAQFGRTVTVTYKLKNAPAVVTFDVETNTLADALGEWVSIGGEAVCNAKGAVWRKVTEADADSEGKYTITWRPDLSWEGHKVSLADGGARAVVTAWALDNTPDYMVVDISAGAQPNTQKYYTSTNFLPGGLLGNPDYRTSSLVMRKILAKDVTWTMGSSNVETKRVTDGREDTHKVTLTNNYYIGVFPVTQAQWAQVAANSSIRAWFTREVAYRPMESVCYCDIRTGVNTDSIDLNYAWPSNPCPSSYLGILRDRVGLDFDLPSEAQWEFAARAGNGTGYWGRSGFDIKNIGNDSNLSVLGRYQYNGGKVGANHEDEPEQDCGVENGTAIVGTYLPNDWGIYDMHGNVFEICLDLYEKDIAVAMDAEGNPYNGRTNVNPSNPEYTLSGSRSSSRVGRGGSWKTQATNSRPAARVSYTFDNRTNNYGFRLVCTAGLK